MGLYSKIVPEKVRNMIRPFKTPISLLMRGLLQFRSGYKVLSGPFKGMPFRYPQMEYAMLLGTWEKELSEIWNRVLAKDFELMVDVGAAEGYYAVGMMFRKKGARVIAYEMEDHVRSNLEALRSLNEVKLDIRGKCDLDDLVAFGTELEDAFLLMDVEGFEAVLLDPVRVPAFRRSWILVELHDLYVEGCSELLRERFDKSHHIELIEGRDRVIQDLPQEIGAWRKCFTPNQWLPFMDEGRPHPMSWYFMTPRAAN